MSEPGKPKVSFWRRVEYLAVGAAVALATAASAIALLRSVRSIL